MTTKSGAAPTSSSFATIRGAIRINMPIPARIIRRALISGQPGADGKADIGNW